MTAKNKPTQKLSASLEDYLEAIYNLQADGEQARSKDIAENLDVSRASVTGALRLLKQKQLVNYQPYDAVTLTNAGKDAAAEVARRHNVLKYFLIKILGVQPEAAQIAACKTEHTLGAETFAKLLAFTEFVREKQKQGQDLAGQFEKFCQKEKAKKNVDTKG